VGQQLDPGDSHKLRLWFPPPSAAPDLIRYAFMTTIELVSLVMSLAGLFLGYLGARGELDRLRRNRKLPKLIKERRFYERLHASADAQLAYLAEAILTVCAIAGASVMMTAIDGIPPETTGLSTAIKWCSGGAVYLFSVFKLGRFYRATTKYDETIARLDRELSNLGD